MFLPALFSHVTGSPFQLSVWEILRQIPYGETTTYGQIAKQLAAERVQNAKVFLDIQKEFGSFDRYLWGFTQGKVMLNTDTEVYTALSLALPNRIVLIPTGFPPFQAIIPESVHPRKMCETALYDSLQQTNDTGRKSWRF